MFQRLCLWTLLVSSGTILRAQTATPQASASSVPPVVKVSPVSARPGDTLKIIATADNCPTDTNAKGWLTKDSLAISGSDVVLTYLQNDDCSVTVTAVVAAKPINR